MKRREALSKSARLLIASGLFVNSANIIVNRCFINLPDGVAIFVSLVAIALIMSGVYQCSKENNKKSIGMRRGKDAQ